MADTNMLRRRARLLTILSTGALCGVAAAVQTALAAGPADNDRREVSGIEFLGQVTLPTGTLFGGTEVGGLSGIAYDAARDVYYAISDDRSQLAPARFYTLSIDLEDGALNDGDVAFQNVTTLRDESGNPFPALSLDPEAIALSPDDTLFISSEGDANAGIAPFVNEFSLSGQQLNALPVPLAYLPVPDVSGIRNNLAFESLTIPPDGLSLYTATENALLQDGPAADVGVVSQARVLRYDLITGLPAQEFVYITEPVAAEPIPADQFRTNGLVELLATDNDGSFLALERSFSVGVGNGVQIYQVRSQGALDVNGLFDLFNEDLNVPFEIDPPVQKRLLLDLADLGLTLDNLEGLALGPVLPDGRRSLIVVSDNNFSSTQFTQFLAFALDFDTIPAVQPALETPQVIDDPESGAPLVGDADDPAIWVHPYDPAQSLVITALRDGGLAVHGLDGQVLQTIAPATYGEQRYNNVDLVYGFRLGLRRVDLAVFSDRANDTLLIFEIDPTTRRLTEIGSPDLPASIFGIDDGEATAYGLAGYLSPVDGRAYAFVSQRDGNLVAQLELLDDGQGRVTAQTVRMLTLPTPTSDAEDSQSEGMVVDQQRGLLYVGVESEVGIVRYPAEPGGGDEGTVVLPIDAPFVEPDIEGLTLYYGPDETGHLLVSSQGNHTFLVLDRAGDNAFQGRFVIGAADGIDQTNETDGADVVNANLGPAFPGGLLVVQDGADDPQSVVVDDEELENNAANFKYVPWESVAQRFDPPLITDTVAYDPRGTVAQQFARLRGDVAALATADALPRLRARKLDALLRVAEQLARRERTRRAATLLLNSFVRQVENLENRGLDPDLAASLRTSARALGAAIARGTDA